MTPEKQDERKRWLDQPENVTKLVRLLWVACAILVIAEFFYHKHPYFGFDGSFAFYAVFGFLSYCFIVFSAKGFRRLVKRDESYYDD